MIVIGMGIFARLVEYLHNREYWLDETSLAANVTQLSWKHLLGPMGSSQLAPSGFLAIEGGLANVLGDSRRVMRLYPMAGGIAGLFLFLRVAARTLQPKAVLLAVAMFAVSDDLIYFSSEMKQYATDVAAALACLWIGLWACSASATARQLVALGAAGIVIVWFSHPTAFVLAGVGTVLLLSALHRRAWREFAAISVVVLAWLVSFVGVYLTSRSQLGYRRDMWSFWAFAFPPMPPDSVWDATWIARRFLYLFLNPLDFATPLGPRLSALPALIFFVVGVGSMGRRNRKALAILIAPVFFTLLANAFHLYPFHGRLVLFLMPSLLLLIAEGAAVVMTTTLHRGVRVAILCSLLLFPTLHAVSQLAGPRNRGGFSPFGDRRSPEVDPLMFPF